MKNLSRIAFGFASLWLASVSMACAQDSLADQARAAAAQLQEARSTLERTTSTKNRVKALTQTIASFENGLAVMRDSLRLIASQKRSVQERLDQQEVAYSQLLGVLLSIDKSPVQAQIIHPDGPLTTARSSMLVADILPALQAKVSVLRADMDELSYLSDLQVQVVEDLQTGLNNLQTARTELSRAITDRTDIPTRFIEDPAQTAILLAASDTLDIFADGIEMIALNEVTTSLPSISDRIGTLPLPVAGRVVRYYGEADAAGIKRSGIIVATSPQAIVTSPTAATIRYVGPLLDYGLVSMIEPQNGTLFVFAGLGQVFGTIGQVIPAGSPIGVMGGNSQTIDSILEQSEKGTGVVRSETLYIEVRQDKEPQDPLIWFRTIEE
ncbi:MAG: murein hydrolase activator EnvC family protein [Paracoccaceae bacterium]|jgi:septal ring factor EnvC (AmiA/AmiB activator)